MGIMIPYKLRGDGLIELRVKVKPKSSKLGLLGFWDEGGKEELLWGLRSPPEQGKANRELEIAIGKCLGVPKTAVHVVSGASSRHKCLLITGADEKKLQCLLTTVSV